jgi:hypothetical protein
MSLDKIRHVHVSAEVLTLLAEASAELRQLAD